MNLLLDTHTLIWFLLGNRRLSQAARRAIENTKNRALVSSVSGYEIAIKCMQGKIDFTVSNTLSTALRGARFDELPVSMAHAIAAGQLAGPHRDPWDRLLMAQSRAEDLTLVTGDSTIASYGVKTLW